MNNNKFKVTLTYFDMNEGYVVKLERSTNSHVKARIGGDYVEHIPNTRHMTKNKALELIYDKLYPNKKTCLNEFFDFILGCEDLNDLKCFLNGFDSLSYHQFDDVMTAFSTSVIVVSYVLDNFEVDLNYCHNGIVPHLHRSVSMESRNKVSKLLVDYGADFLSKLGQENSAYEIAEKHNPEMLEYLKKRVLDVLCSL